MKITPLDIQQMVFKMRLRGYDRQDVDRFLEEVAQTVELLNRENSTLREKLSAAEEQLAELRKTESTLTQTLLSTQMLADDIKRRSERDAELIIKEAEMKAADLIRQAGMELATLQRDLSDLRKQRLLAVERLRSTIRTFERILEIEEGEEGEHAVPTEPLADSNRS
jgi:cell division initiation protein